MIYNEKTEVIQASVFYCFVGVWVCCGRKAALRWLYYYGICLMQKYSPPPFEGGQTY